jgi:hypothetical protein
MSVGFGGRVARVVTVIYNPADNRILIGADTETVRSLKYANTYMIDTRFSGIIDR